MFAIEVESAGLGAEVGGGAGFAVGRITVNGFSETFEMPLGFWKASDYQISWCNAFAILEQSANSTSCLMASMLDPDTANYLFCWPLYRDGESVCVQSSMILLGELGFAFDPGRPWLSVAPHSAVDDDGNLISEWVTSMGSLRDFFGVRCSEVL
ncbi:hypothetical protein ACIG87_20555 [Micromonospora sp. NPDC051925]|uniref:hypothetical protein n=1 Tax=Micromonospora sp. NPDC051925 TaxID=3364288 RepID=UPI0037C9DEA6